MNTIVLGVCWFLIGVLFIPIIFIFISVKRVLLWAAIWALPFALPYIVNDMCQVATPWQHKAGSGKIAGSNSR